MESVLKSNTTASYSTEKTMLPGLITGQIAGLIMAVVVMLVFAVFLGKNFLFPVQVQGFRELDTVHQIMLEEIRQNHELSEDCP